MLTIFKFSTLIPVLVFEVLELTDEPPNLITFKPTIFR